SRVHLELAEVRIGGAAVDAHISWRHLVVFVHRDRQRQSPSRLLGVLPANRGSDRQGFVPASISSPAWHGTGRLEDELAATNPSGSRLDPEGAGPAGLAV